MTGKTRNWSRVSPWHCGRPCVDKGSEEVPGCHRGAEEGIAVKIKIKKTCPRCHCGPAEGVTVALRKVSLWPCGRCHCGPAEGLTMTGKTRNGSRVSPWCCERTRGDKRPEMGPGCHCGRAEGLAVTRPEMGLGCHRAISEGLVVTKKTRKGCRVPPCACERPCCNKKDQKRVQGVTVVLQKASR